MLADHGDPNQCAGRNSGGHAKKHIIKPCTDNDAQQRPEGGPANRDKSHASVFKATGQENEPGECYAGDADEFSDVAQIIRDGEKSDNPSNHKKDTECSIQAHNDML